MVGCRFQFGDDQGGLIHPLEGDEKLAISEMQMYQYFIEVVPTDVHGLLGTTHTYQYSVKEQVSRFRSGHSINLLVSVIIDSRCYQ